MMVNIPAIKNKYLRWAVATIAVFILVPTTIPLSFAVNLFIVLRNSCLLDVTLSDLHVACSGIKQMYRGKK